MELAEHPLRQYLKNQNHIVNRLFLKLLSDFIKNPE